MKPFDSKEALAGKLCVTRNGDLVAVVVDISDVLPEAEFPIGGYIKAVGDDNWRSTLEWWGSGGQYGPVGTSGEDIIGMYEEPAPNQPLVDIGKLPATLKTAKTGDSIYYIEEPLSICKAVYDKGNRYQKNKLDAGMYFKTIKDAQAWLDAMKGARR